MRVRIRALGLKARQHGVNRIGAVSLMTSGSAWQPALALNLSGYGKPLASPRPVPGILPGYAGTMLGGWNAGSAGPL